MFLTQERYLANPATSDARSVMLRIPLPEDDGFALAVQVKPLTDALAFRGRSPRVTKRATHPSVHRVNSCWQCFYKGFSVPSAYSGKRLRSSIFLAPSCATGQDLRSCVKNTLATQRERSDRTGGYAPEPKAAGVSVANLPRPTGNRELATGNCPLATARRAFPWFNYS